MTSTSGVTDYLILGACISDHNEVERRPFGVFQDGLDIEGQGLQYGRNIVFVLWRIPKFSNFLEIWVAKLVARLLAMESRHLSKIQYGRHKQRSDQHTLARPKNI